MKIIEASSRLALRDGGKITTKGDFDFGVGHLRLRVLAKEIRIINRF